MGKSDTLSHRADHGTRAGDNSNVTLLRLEFFTAHTVRALSGLSLEGEEHNILWDIHKGNCEGKQEDTVAKSADEHTTALYVYFVVFDDFQYSRDLRQHYTTRTML